MFTGIYQRYILHKEIYHGTERLNNAIAHRRYRLAGDLTYAPMIASTLTLGFGGSAGAEGPIAYTGAAIGSNIGKAFRVSPGMMRSFGRIRGYFQGSCRRSPFFVRGSFDRPERTCLCRPLSVIAVCIVNFVCPKRMHHRPCFS